jgi:ABC-type multidrug transport system ATPase subunit
VALMCLPKALVPDEKNNDVLYRPFSMGAGWNPLGQSARRNGDDGGNSSSSSSATSLRGSGWLFTFTPNTDDALDISRRAYVNFLCADSRSQNTDVNNVSYMVPRMVGMGTNFEALKQLVDDSVEDPTDLQKLSSATAARMLLSGASGDGAKEWREDRCSDTCLRDTTEFQTKWIPILNEFVKGFDTEDAMEAYRYEKTGEVLVEIVFSSSSSGDSVSNTEDKDDTSTPNAFNILDEETKYTLRLNRTHFGGSKSLSRATDRQYSTEWEGETEQDYWKRFERSVQLQHAIDQAIVDKKDDNGPFSVQIDSSIKPFPALGYTYNFGGIIAASFIGFVGTIAFQSSAVLVMKTIVLEKELKLREGMKMMGLTDFTYWSSWLLTHWVSAMITVTSMTLIGIYPFEYTNQWFQFLFYSVWVLSNILFNFMITTWFDRSLVATIVSLFIYNLSIQPSTQIRIVAPEGSAAWLGTCLLPAGSLNMWGHVLSQLELTKDGITAKTWSKSVVENANVSASSVFAITVFNCFFYGFLTFYFDNVLPKEFGQRKPPWFLFTKSYWFPRTEVHLLKHTNNDQNEVENRARYCEPLPEESTESISVKSLRKVFANGVSAVDNLSVAFVPGQVSALLGHNGAGKTTTINILTGATMQTSGKATINGFDVATQMSSIRLSLGICPQFDVLWPALTCREHLKLYAALSQNKDVMANLEASIETALREVDLLNKIDEQSRNLSGGMKRKLSLACAFIGNPSIVFLDEPTSGMDPYSRRFIWEVIRKRAQTGKTILLTTHFMDEADLLCDRVAIMSAGSLACVGSPVFLKSRFGSGYTLTLAKDIDKESGSSSSGDNSAQYLTGLQKDQSRKALRFVQSVVANSSLISDVGTEVAISLPLDATHLFAELLQKIDRELPTLGFASYGITCTTLEEVFLKVASKAEHSMTEEKEKNEEQEKYKGHPHANTVGIVDKGESTREAFVANYEERAEYITGSKLLVRQFRFLLWKRYLNWKRTIVSTFLQLLLPCAFFALALFMTTVQFKRDIVYKPVTFSRDMHLDSRDILATYRNNDGGVADKVVRQMWPDQRTRIADAFGEQLSCKCNCPASKQEAYYAAMTCCMSDPTLVPSAYENNTVETLYAACASTSIQTEVTGFVAYDPPGDCATSSIHGVDTQINSECEASADVSFDATLLGSFDELRKPCNLRKSSAPCDAIWIDSYVDENGAENKVTGGVYRHTLYTDVTAFHAIGTTTNEANTAILRHRSGNANAKIETTLKWFESKKTYKDGEIVENTDNAIVLLFTAVFSVLGASILTASFAVFPVNERANNTKHLQLVSGVNKSMYWISHFIADVLQMIIPLITLTIVFAGYNVEMYRGRIGDVFALLLAFLIASIPFSHAYGFFFKTGFTAYVGEIGIISFLGVITTIAGIILYNLRDLNAQTKQGADISKHVFALVVPHYSLGRGLFDLGMLNEQKQREIFDFECNCLKSLEPDSVSETMRMHYVYLFVNFVTFTFMVFVLERKETVKGRKHISEYNEEKRLKRIRKMEEKNEKIRLAAERRRAARQNRGRNAFTERPSSASLGLEQRGHLSEHQMIGVASEQPEEEDEDVVAERRRVLSTGSDLTANDGVIIKDLVKRYGSKKANAVDHLSVGMAHSQVFGLLGVNGAGKTTTFKTITGEFAPTSGDALIRDYTNTNTSSGTDRRLFSISNDLTAARQRMGYCPQFDGLQLNLTGREHIKFYAAIRGMPLGSIDSTVSKLLDEIQLIDAADRACGTYSGGMKRKLSVALALVGAPCVVLLDEPSTGMDPEAKRFLWDVISAAAKSRTIILTSHSMEECEALCHRVGIMVSGQFSCIGSLQHLKNRFSEGYSVTVNFEKSKKSKVVEFSEKDLKASIAESHSSELKLRVGHTQDEDEIKLWQVFAKLQQMKTNGLIIDYSVSQTTLEQVFVRFASKQGQFER